MKTFIFGLFFLTSIVFFGCKKPAAVSAPSITSINPASGVAGVSVTITGTDFDAVASNNNVNFNGVAAIVTSATATSL